MTGLDITVAIPAHPARLGTGMLDRALRSVWMQQKPAAGVSVAMDLERGGASRTRQRALEGVTTEWVAFLDSDDYLLPQHLQVLEWGQQASGADYVYTWYHLEQNGVWLDHDPVFPPEHHLLPWDPENPRQTTITTLVRTDLAKAVGFWAVEDEQKFPDGHRIGEDYVFTLECNRLGKVFKVPNERTWVWTHHGLNSSGRPGQGDA